jgi:high-affinity Fe2+/Pb2+ permease
MSGDPTDALKQAWLGQPTTQPGISLHDVKRASKKFQRHIGIRNLVEYAAAVFVVIGYSQMMLKKQELLVQIGCVLIVIGTLYIVVQIHSRMSSQKAPADALGGTFVDFHRAAVMRQIAGLESVLYWYLLPFAPGWTLFIIQTAIEKAWAGFTFLVTSALVLGFGIVHLNKWAARRLRRKLEEFDAIGVES